jgi:hypothetical protein
MHLLHDVTTSAFTLFSNHLKSLQAVNTVISLLIVWYYTIFIFETDAQDPLYAMTGVLQGEEVQPRLVLTSALEGGEWSASRPGRILPAGKETPVPTLQEAGWVPVPAGHRGKPLIFETIRLFSIHTIQNLKVNYWLSEAHIHLNRTYKFSFYIQKNKQSVCMAKIVCIMLVSEIIAVNSRNRLPVTIHFVGKMQKHWILK